MQASYQGFNPSQSPTIVPTVYPTSSRRLLGNSPDTELSIKKEVDNNLEASRSFAHTSTAKGKINEKIKELEAKLEELQRSIDALRNVIDNSSD
jgi:hypothetical protein